jgi:D-serine deaminase-like pyridoxal phosphate-dependent protein
MINQHWSKIDMSKVDTPSLIIDKDLVNYNIDQAIRIVGDVNRLRPHVKTHKMLEVANLQMKKGIFKFKCATIAEAEMLGIAKAKDVLIAYPLQGPKILRFLHLQNGYPDTRYSFLVDNIEVIKQIQDIFQSNNSIANVFIDINNGQDRTGIKIKPAYDLIDSLEKMNNIDLIGVHCYDGHIRMESLEKRKHEVINAFKPVMNFKNEIENSLDKSLEIVAGGSPSFPIHAEFHKVDCSPGTWIFWDARYGSDYKEQNFIKAAVVATRVISQLNDFVYCLDLGHKSVASESPFPRIEFTESIDCEQIGHSEEHLIIKCKEPNALNVGQVLTAYPYHICPTTALYAEANIIINGKLHDVWKVTARNRKITI